MLFTDIYQWKLNLDSFLELTKAVSGVVLLILDS